MGNIREIIVRLKEIYNVKTNNELAEKMGVKYQTLNTWIKRNKIPYDYLIKIGHNDPIDLNWLLLGQEDSEKTGDTTNQDAYRVTQLDLQASAGTGIQNFHTQETQVVIDKALFRYPVQPQNLRIITVVGDSMEPTIPDGSHIIIDTTQTDHIDGIYVIRLDDNIMLKRLQHNLDGTIHIISDNPHYTTQLYDPHQTQVNFAIIGRKILTIQ